MKFIEMTGKTLGVIIQDDELAEGDLEAANVTDETIVRINETGDIEVRRHNGWDVIGGLLGQFEDRVRAATGLDWA
jgi:hypothetical protein